MKNIIVMIIIQCAINLLALAGEEKFITEIIEVEMISLESRDYPFLKYIGFEKDNNVIKLDLDEDTKNTASSPLIMLPEGIVCVKRNVINLDMPTDLSWIYNLFDEPQKEKEEDSLLELSKINRNFLIRFLDRDLLISFYKRSDGVLFMTLYKMQTTIMQNNHLYFVGPLPSSQDNFSWRRTGDSKVSVIAKILLTRAENR